MERNAIQWLGAPCCLRGSFAFYKSFSCRRELRESSEHQDSEGRESAENHGPERQESTENHGPERQESTENHGPERRESSENPGPERRESSQRPAAVWKLGEFYFIRCSPQEPVCIAELALLWEDRAQRHLLASSRLYYLPEDTPRGRTREHGEDEVLAVSKKMVIRVEDLVSWTCEEPPGWRRTSPTNGTDTCRAPAPTSDPSRPKRQSERSRVRVLSYLQYCRFRSLQRRTQHRPGPPSPHDPHLLALGGLRLPPHTLVLYCRDTFTHPTLDNSTSLWTQLGCTSVSLKGRPRKRRGRDGKGAERSPLGQSESWIERMKENVMGSVEVPWEGGWLPHPEEQPFLDQLYGFMERRGSPISKVPNLGFKKIDLFLLFSVVKRLGGYERVTSERLWKQVYNELGGSPGSTSAATCTRRHYEKLILAYEQHLTGGEAELPKPLLPSPANRSKELQKAKVTAANQKEELSSPNGQAGQGDPGVKPARKRGRPPSRRNSKPAKTPRTEATPTTLPQATPTAASLQEGPLNFATNLPAAPLSKPNPEDPRAGQPDPALTPLPKAEPLSPSSLSALTRLHMSGPVGPFTLPKGLCPLELFRSRLGLAAVEGSAPNPALQPAPVLLLPPKTSTAGRDDPRAGPLPDGGWREEGDAGCDAGCDAGRDAGRPRAPMPPLRVLPLDIDCSLQVRQLMRTRLGSAQLTSFARRLTQVLAHDLSKAHPLAPAPPPAALPANQEQALPLNLSKRCGAKRPAGEPTGGAWLEGGQSQDGAVNWESLGAGLNHGVGGVSLLGEQDQPADLSCPGRARASLRQHNGPGVGPQGAPGAAKPAPQPPLVNGGDGGGAWDSHPDAEADCRGAE